MHLIYKGRCNNNKKNNNNSNNSNDNNIIYYIVIVIIIICICSGSDYLKITISWLLRLGGMISAYKIVPDELDEIKVGDIHALHLQICSICTDNLTS